MKIENFQESHIQGVLQLTNEIIGPGYYHYNELLTFHKKSLWKNFNSSMVLVESRQVLGVRLSFPPGNWEQGKGNRLSPRRWPHPKNETAYFQSVLVSPQVRHQGWARELSLQSMQELKKMGAKGIVCHSWVESPGDGSRIYLKKLGFQSINCYPEYWKNVDYLCTRCGKPCFCTAEEMYRDLEIDI